MKTARKGNWYEIVIPEKWSSFTLDHLLRNIWNVPRKMIHTFRMEKRVSINGEQVQWEQKLIPGDRLQMELFTAEGYGVLPIFHEVDVLFEDDHLLILNKPAGMDTHPNTTGQTDTLTNAAAFYLQAKGECLKPRHIHRLDRDTTGAVLFAKTALAGAILDRLLEERIIKRTYLAITDGLIAKKNGTINKSIGRDRHHSVRRRISPTGQTATTHFKVLRLDKPNNRSLIKCNLDTGRTHQIRVHLSAIGHPLSGDSLYGGSRIFSRQALHAVKMELPHPFTGEIITCHAPFLDKPAIFKGVEATSI